jgi:hypothetical protein
MLIKSCILRFSESFRIPQLRSIIFRFDTAPAINTDLTQRPVTKCLTEHPTRYSDLFVFHSLLFVYMNENIVSEVIAPSCHLAPFG